jgi:hypothetical protein
MAGNVTNTLSPDAQSANIGVIFTKGMTITAAQFDMDMGAVAAVQSTPNLFIQNELFGAFMIVDAAITTYTIRILLRDGTSVLKTYPNWTWVPMIGQQIQAAGTSATLVSIVGGQ